MAVFIRPSTERIILGLMNPAAPSTAAKTSLARSISLRHHWRPGHGITIDNYSNQSRWYSTESISQRENFVRVVEVSARDGLQNLALPAVPTSVKKDLVERLLDSGLQTIEVGSFVRGDRVPQQMADTSALLPSLQHLRANHLKRDLHFPVLIPNMKGLDALLSLETDEQMLTDEIAVFVSATEPFSLANNNASVETVLQALPAVIDKALSRGYRVRGYASCVMTDPYAGPTLPGQVVHVVRRLLDMGCYEVSLGDTTGEGSPKAWRTLWDALITAAIPTSRLACHDTFSMALPSILTLLPLGLRTIDASLAGLGGCPYSPGATGNVATEDVVYALHKLGFETGVDLDKLAEAGDWLCKSIGVQNESKVGRALGARQALRKAQTEQNLH